MTISVIIPALNEESTIQDVIRTAITHPEVGEVIVVDDGSEDSTAQKAREAGGKVVSHSENMGKAEALETGVSHAKYSMLFFMDADLIGLSHEIMNIPIQAVKSGDFDMFIAIVKRDEKTLKKIPSELQILGGTRVLSKEIWHLVPEQYRKGFQIEIALNYFAEHHNKKIGSKIMEEFTHRTKEEKLGLLSGLWKRIYMILEIIKVVALLYLLHKLFFKAVRVPVKIVDSLNKKPRD